MERERTRARTESVPHIALADDSKNRARIDLHAPICVVSSTQLHFGVNLPEDPKTVIRIVVLSNKDNPSILNADEEAGKSLSFTNVGEQLLGSGTYSNAFLKWKDSKFSSGSHAPEKSKRFIVFALGLMNTANNSIMTKTECFFVITHASRRVRGPFYEYLVENIANLNEIFQFKKPEVLHSCAELVKAATDSHLPECCSHAKRASLVAIEVNHAPVHEPNLSFFLDDLLFQDIDLEPESIFGPHFSSPMHGQLDEVNEALVQKVGDSWGRCGIDDNLGFFIVKVESEIGIRVFPMRSLTITISLTNVDRVKRDFDPIRLIVEPQGVVIPLPRPTKIGAEIVDVTVDNLRPSTIVYKVCL